MFIGLSHCWNECVSVNEIEMNPVGLVEFDHLVSRVTR